MTGEVTSGGEKGKGDEHLPNLDAGLRAGFRPGPRVPEVNVPPMGVPEPDMPSTMNLATGRMLSFYEVLEPLGRGGMGEVYRARDTRLQREVALKVLPGVLVDDEEHLSRFRREARILAALNHPNIATIHGLDHVDEIHFLVLELVPGETLRDRLERGPLPVAEALQVARQVAAGLEAAHAANIVHRDLKPANVVRRADGSVKILDFGLAKRTEVADRFEEGFPTKAFQVLGTPGYLSPEQARGEAADERADVWAFGCLLYECLAGARAFPGSTVSESIRAIYEEPVALEALPPETPPTARLIVSRCLAKDSGNRLRAIRDVKLLLEDTLGEPSVSKGPEAGETGSDRPRNQMLKACLALAIVASGILAFFLVRASMRASESVAGTRTLGLPFDTELGWRETSANLSKLGRGSPLLAVSPDGLRIVYCAKTADWSAIFVHVLGEPEARLLRKTGDARAPFFAPDGERVGFLEGDTIQVVSIHGGTPRPIHQLESPAPNFSACFTSSGESIIYATRKGLRIVSRDGSDDRQLTAPDPARDEVEHLGPSVLPDGEHVLFNVATGTRTSIAVLSLTTKEWGPVLRDGGSARYALGRLVYASAADIQSAPFDPSAASILGISRPVEEQIFATPCAGGGATVTHFDVAPNGTLAYAPAPPTPTRSRAYWVDRDGEGVGQEIYSGPGDWKHPRIAPGGGRFSVDILDDTGTKDVHLYDLELGFVGKLTQDGMSVNSAWSPNKRATVRSTHLAQLRLEDRPLFPEWEGAIYADSWTSDGRTLIVTRRKSGRWSLWKWETGADEPVSLFPDTRDENARYGQVSPDSQWLAYVSDVQGEPHVFVRPYPALEPRVKVSRDGGGAPVWSRDGSELFYRRPDGTMIAVAFETQPRFRVKEPAQELFRNDYDADPAGHQHYDVSEDGRRFLMLSNEFSAPDRVHVVPGALSAVVPPR